MGGGLRGGSAGEAPRGDPRRSGGRDGGPRGGPRETLSLPWAEWTHHAPRAQVMVYTNASRREMERGVGTGAGLVVQMDDT